MIIIKSVWRNATKNLNQISNPVRVVYVFRENPNPIQRYPRQINSDLGIHHFFVFAFLCCDMFVNGILKICLVIEIFQSPLKKCGNIRNSTSTIRIKNQVRKKNSILLHSIFVIYVIIIVFY